MDLTLLSIILVFCIFYFNRVKCNNAAKLLNESQREIIFLASSNAKKAIKYPGIILIVSLFIALFTIYKYKQLIYLFFFILCFVHDMIYYVNYKKQLLSTEIPDQFIIVIERTKFYHLGGIFIVVVAFALNIII